MEDIKKTVLAGDGYWIEKQEENDGWVRIRGTMIASDNLVQRLLMGNDADVTGGTPQLMEQ